MSAAGLLDFARMLGRTSTGLQACRQYAQRRRDVHDGQPMCDAAEPCQPCEQLVAGWVRERDLVRANVAACPWGLRVLIKSAFWTGHAWRWLLGKPRGERMV